MEVTQNDYLERDMIAQMLLSPTVIDEFISGRIDAEDVVCPIRRAIFESAVEEYRAGPLDVDSIGVLQILDRASAKCKADRETIRQEIVTAFESTTQAVGIGRTTRDLMQVIQRRRLAKAGAEIVKLSTSGASGRLVTEEARAIMAQTLDRNHENESVDAKSAIVEAVTRAYSKKSAKRLTNVHAIDSIMGGFPPGSMNTIAARPGGGKSTFGVHVACRYAAAGGSVGYITAEMTTSEIALIVAAQMGGIVHRNLMQGQLSEHDMGRFHDAQRILDDRVFKIHHEPRMTLEKLVGIMTRMARRSGCTLIVFDYLQLLTIARRTRVSRHEELAEITRELKTVAGELGVILIVLSQMNRDIEKDGRPREPRMSDLGDSGAIERDSDSVTFLWPSTTDADAVPNRTAPDVEKINFIVAKHRSGDRGRVELFWTKKTRCFHEPK